MATNFSRQSVIPNETLKAWQENHQSSRRDSEIAGTKIIDHRETRVRKFLLQREREMEPMKPAPPVRAKRWRPMARLSHWPGDLWLRKLDNCEINLETPSASRYFWRQFFASLKKWIGARNPVRIGSSCAAVTGYNFPMGQSPKTFGGEGGKKVRPAGAGPEARSQNICPVHLIRL